MSEEHEQQEKTDPERDEALGDLDVSSDEAEKVTGGRASDPCEGGESLGH